MNQLWPWTIELFQQDEVDRELQSEGLAPDLDTLRPLWEATVHEVLAKATIVPPKAPMRMTGGRKGRHTEYLGHLLAEMQIVARSHPGATW
jgi:ring-1,2-phenylacetyl-CoA epoxidase subunit PaaC